MRSISCCCAKNKHGKHRVAVMSQIDLCKGESLSFVGGRLAVACDDGCLRLFRIESGQDGLIFEASLPALQTRLLSVAWHPNGSVAYTGTSEASLHAWDVQTRREIIRIHTGCL